MDIRKLAPEPRLLERDEAHALVDVLNATEDACGWSYRVKPAKAIGKYHIEVANEEGYVLGDL